jgi:uncharacterized membrane protein
MLPFDLDAPRLLALVLIFACWSLYEPILMRFGHGTLNAQLHVVRLRWMRMLLESNRENRVFDGILLGQLSGSISFFGSATLIVLAGLVGTLASINRVHESMNGVPFLPPITLPLFTVYFAALTLIMTFSFFSFAYALRKLGYTIALIGGLMEAKVSNAHSKVMMSQTAMVLTEAVKSMNNGIRGYYFAVAALFLFLGPWPTIAMTLAISGVLLYRQGFSPEALAIERYFKAMDDYEADMPAKD